MHGVLYASVKGMLLLDFEFCWPASNPLFWLINGKLTINFMVFLIKSGTFEVNSQYFAYFMSISSLVFENDKLTFWGCFGHFIMSHLLKTMFKINRERSERRRKLRKNSVLG